MPPRPTLAFDSDLIFVLLLAGVLAALTPRFSLERDQMIPYLTGLRTWAGQVEYRDFYIPHGPLSGWLFSLFLWLTPSGGWALVVSSACLNMAQTAAIWFIVLKATQDRKTAFLASLMTATWFLPIFGSFYHDHLAYTLLTYAYLAWQSRTKQGSLIAGCLLALSFHAKQTVGLVGIFSMLAVLLTERRERARIIRLTAAYVITHALVIGFVGFRAGLSDYFKYNFVYVFHYVTQPQTDKNFFNLVEGLVLPFKIDPIAMIRQQGLGRLLFYPVVISAYAAFALLTKLKQQNRRSPLLFFLLSTLWCAALLGRVHAHLFLGMGLVIALLLESALPKLSAQSAAAGFFTFLALIYGWTLHGRPNKFLPFYDQTDLFPIRVMDTYDSRANQLVVENMRHTLGPYALLSDHLDLTILALRRVPLTQPVIYTNTTVPAEPRLRHQWDEDTIAFFKRKNPPLIFSDYRRNLASLPLLREYLETHYVEEKVTKSVSAYRYASNQ